MITFVALLVVYYTALVALSLWPPYMNAYRAGFRTCGNLLLGRFGSTARVEFTPADPTEDMDDTAGMITKLSPLPAKASMKIKSRHMGYLPTAFALALILATPVPWRRRAVALLWGFLLINGFVLAKLVLQIGNALSNEDTMRVFLLAPATKSLLVALQKVVAMSPVTAYIAPIFIWALVCLRMEDLRRLTRTRTA